MGKVVWSKRALNDLDVIFEFISSDSSRYAHSTIEKVTQSTDILKNQPRAGRVVPEFKEENLRELIVCNYRIIYELADHNQIVVLTVHHSSRKMKYLKLF
jgi:toxin ParE1/3/4